MIKVNTNYFTKEKAIKDAKYCLQQSGNPVDFKPNSFSDFFIRNQHIYLNTSDNTHMVTSLEKGRKSILTVASSGDYIIDSVLNGAEKVVSYDINEFQYYMCEFKIWAIQTLSYKEFIEFFVNIDNANYLSPIYFEKILSGHEDTPTYAFFNEIKNIRYKEESYLSTIQNMFTDFKSILDPDNIVDSDNNRFCLLTVVGPKLMPEIYKAVRLFETNSAIMENVGYLKDEESYNKVKGIIDSIDISFILSNVSDLYKKIDNDLFDEIHLSNIPTYLTQSQYISTIQSLNNCLNIDGLISVYNQSMYKIWFNMIKKDKNFSIPDYVFTKYGDITDDYVKITLNNFYKSSLSNLLDVYKKLSKEKYKIKLIEHPGSDGGFTTVKKDVEMKIYKK